MGMRYNPPPGWPPAPEGFAPEPGWQPDPSWPPPPPGWQLWVSDDEAAPAGSLLQAPEAASSATSAQQPESAGGSTVTRAPLPSYPGTGLRSYPSVARPHDANTTSGWAIASLVVSIVGGAVLGAIFGIIALGKIRDHGQKGRGMAIAGIILSGVWVVVAVVTVVTRQGYATGTPNTQVSTNVSPAAVPSSALDGTGLVFVHGLAVGNCFDWTNNGQPVASVTLIPCRQAHNVQVFATWELSGSSSSFPGNLYAVATQGCEARKASLTASASSLEVSDFTPTQAGWAAGDRVVECLIISPTADLKSSLLTS